MIYMPGDIMSPGYSIVYGGTGSIDNYNNVLRYPYSTTKSLIRKTQNYHYLKDMKFSFDHTISFLGNQIPQGICMAKKYLIISSYSEDEDTLGELKIYDINSGDHVVTLCMDEDSHMGGIAFDGQYLWVCNSSNHTLERLSYDMIEYFVMIGHEKKIDITNMVDSYEVHCTPSCITFYNDCLWVAQYNVITNSQMISYCYDEKDDELIYKKGYRIPTQVQGTAFDEYGAIYLSMSYGRKSSSYIKKYNSVEQMNHSLEDCTMIIELPPCSEELIYQNNQLYVLFESAGEKYLKGTDGLGQSICPLDKILIIDLALP